MASCAGQKSAKWDSIYLKNELVKLQIVPDCGGRIMQYTLGEHAFFWNNPDLVNVAPPESGLDAEGGWLNYGGEKLWPAPQGWDTDQQWPGPPDAVLDGGVHTFESPEEKGALKAIKLTSKEDKRSGIQFSRIIKIFEGTSRVSVDATMKNINSEPIRWGIWSHAQLDASSKKNDDFNKDYRAYCPLNPDSKFHNGYLIQFGLVNNPTFKPDYKKGIMVLHYQCMVGKAGVDSPAGWVATINGETGHAFVQRFIYEPDKAYPDGSSVEFWSHGIGDFCARGKVNAIGETTKEIPYFVESEIISPYAILKAGEKYTYHYDMYTAKIAEGAEVVTCNDMGIVCEELRAAINDRYLSVNGKFGVFYKGYLVPTIIDQSGNATELDIAKIEVNPLKELDVTILNTLLKETPLPAKSHTLALIIKDANGDVLGTLADVQITMSRPLSISTNG